MKLKKAILTLALSTGFIAAQADDFTPLEQQQISIETPGLFNNSNAFTVDFGTLTNKEYCFPLPVAKHVEVTKDNDLLITSVKGDAIKAMFDGVVRMSWDHPHFGNVIVVRHGNGLETVYGGNAQNLVKVGTSVKAGQTLAIIGGENGRYVCTFSIMVNGRRINPEIILGIKTRRIIDQTVLFQKTAFGVDVSVVEPDPWNDESYKKRTGKALETTDPFGGGKTFTLNLANIHDEEWCYPLPGAKVISPYGRRGRRRHTGVDLKTCPNDDILAAFDGVVTMSQRYSGYGNCIIVKHSNGLETLYSHNVKNLVKKGDHVNAGQRIALTGRTGRATTEHLHFECRVNGRPFNPNIIFNHVSRKLRTDKVTFTKSGKIDVSTNSQPSKKK